MVGVTWRPTMRDPRSRPDPPTGAARCIALAPGSRGMRSAADGTQTSGAWSRVTNLQGPRRAAYACR
jgi:hypothetical protein